MPRPKGSTNRMKIYRLVANANEPKSSANIAEQVKLPVREVARHLRILRGKGMIRSISGKGTLQNPMMWRT